jgi:hypothetical protein
MSTKTQTNCWTLSLILGFTSLTFFCAVEHVCCQVLLGLETTWISEAISNGKIIDRLNEDNVKYSFLSKSHNEFHKHASNLVVYLFSNWHICCLFIQGIDNNGSIFWNHGALPMWAWVADRLHGLLFLLMHFIVGGSAHREKYQSYLIHNTKHYKRMFYWLASTIMTFQRYHKGANLTPSLVKLIAWFLPQELNVLFIQYILLVWLV